MLCNWRQRKSSCPLSKSITPCTCRGSEENGGLTLDCNNQVLGDDNISRILSTFLPSEEKLGQILLSNNSLSKVPEEISQFTHLAYVELLVNRIRSIKSGAFKFPDKVVKPGYVDLGYNQISLIENGAFQGSGRIWILTAF